MRTIVVGAGSAGAVIAARLSEDGTHEVLLLEAGPDYPPGHALPEDLRNAHQNSLHKHDWGYTYRATDHKTWSVLDMGYPRGRVVGGSSAVNTCIALRGQPYDYDEWAAMGLPEWSWEKCLPFFKRLETDLDVDNEWHGKSGPIPVRRHTPEELVPWQAAFLAGCEELGFPKAYDTNNPTTTGAGPHAMNKIEGVRMSAAMCYLTAAVRARDNLTIQPLTIVRRVLIANGRAVGLEVERHGRVFDIHGDRIVLCGGAVATPGILLRSGVGSEADVARLGVDLVAKVPGVAARLLDHPGLALFFWPNEKARVSVHHPLVQVVCRYTSKGSDCPNDMQLQPGSFTPMPHLPFAVPTLAMCIGKPKFGGTIRFTSARPTAAPEMATSLLTHEEDRAMAREALAWTGKLAKTKAISALGKPIYPSRKPFDDAWRFLRPLEQISGSGYHPSGTAPMGPDSDPMAVTDGRGRVRGVRGLYVCDASLMPTITSSNTNFPTLMMGERFGAWLTEERIV